MILEILLQRRGKPLTNKNGYLVFDITDKNL